MTIPNQNTINELLHYSPSTGELIWKSRPRYMFDTQRGHSLWNVRYSGQPAFTATDRKGYKVGALFNHVYRAHRVIWKLMHGTDADQIDHINGNKIDNRFVNLRSVTAQENQRNLKMPDNNTSGVCGVSWDRNRNKWSAKIAVNSKTINLGRFEHLHEAAQARKEAEAKYGFHPNHGT